MKAAVNKDYNIDENIINVSMVSNYSPTELKRMPYRLFLKLVETVNKMQAKSNK